jgi:hypothetical protein
LEEYAILPDTLLCAIDGVQVFNSKDVHMYEWLDAFKTLPYSSTRDLKFIAVITSNIFVPRKMITTMRIKTRRMALWGTSGKVINQQLMNLFLQQLPAALAQRLRFGMSTS